MNDADRTNGVLSVVGGDAERARQLRANIAVFARRTGDPEITRMVNDVLAGHRNVREIFRSRRFREIAAENFGRLEQGLERLSDADRRRVLTPLTDPGDADSESAEAERAGSDRRSQSVRDSDLPVSPIGPRGDVEPDVPLRRR